MAATRDDSKLLIPFIPSLLHFASVKIALPLLNEFSFEMLTTVFREIQQRNKKTSEENMEETAVANRAKESLLLIPAHLREGVLNVVGCMESEVNTWGIRHPFCSEFKDQKSAFHWKSDGSINKIKTAQVVVRYKKINIEKRFHMACMYCFEKRVQKLWEKLQASGRKKICRAFDNFMIHFWVKYLRAGSPGTWEQAAREYLEFANVQSLRNVNPLMTVWFHLVPPENRRRCLKFLEFTSFDDLKFCLYTLTKSEEEQILKRHAGRILSLYLKRPLKHLFLEATEKVWNYINEKHFKKVLKNLLFRMNDFEYVEIFEGLWNRSPDYLREKAREEQFLSEGIDFCLKILGKKNMITNA